MKAFLKIGMVVGIGDDMDSTSMNEITTTVCVQMLYRNEILDISQTKGLLIVL
jgi:hypothetical protein